MLTHIARDCQTNETFHLFTNNPLQELLEMFDSRTSELMYIDSKDGDKTFQTGWVIAGRWFEMYSVTPMRFVLSANTLEGLSKSVIT